MPRRKLVQVLDRVQLVATNSAQGAEFSSEAGSCSEGRSSKFSKKRFRERSVPIGTSVADDLYATVDNVGPLGKQGIYWRNNYDH